MTVKDLIKILKTYPEDYEIVLKEYSGASDLWTPKEVKYVEILNKANKVLIN